jgi:hypothetical protein
MGKTKLATLLVLRLFCTHSRVTVCGRWNLSKSQQPGVPQKKICGVRLVKPHNQRNKPKHQQKTENNSCKIVLELKINCIDSLLMRKAAQIHHSGSQHD